MRRRTVLAGVAGVVGIGAYHVGEPPSQKRVLRVLAELAAENDSEREQAAVQDAEAALVEQLNAARAAAGRAKLQQSDGLTTAARAHARDMHTRDFYGHENPDGEQPWDRAPCRATETIQRGPIGNVRAYGSDRTFDTGSAAGLAGYTVLSWTNSERHNDIMVDGAHRAVGVGVAIADGEFFAVAMFC